MIAPDLVNPSFARSAWRLGDCAATDTAITSEEI